jgi:hypothetical protein
MGQFFTSSIQPGALTFERGFAGSFGYERVRVQLAYGDQDDHGCLRRSSPNGRDELGLFRIVAD